VYKHVQRLDLPYALPVVCYNGGSCRVFPPHPTHPQAQQRTLYDAPLSAAAVRDVLGIARELGVMAQVRRVPRASLNYLVGLPFPP
jgi:hypothetical protein